MSTELTQSALQFAFNAICAVPVIIAHRDGLTTAGELSVHEALRLETISSEKRRHEYRLGRSALKAVLECLAKDMETTRIQWPSPFCTLSHSEGHAVAVGLPTATGVGVDLQLRKVPPLEMASRILSEDTLDQWRALPEPEQAKALQRYWTANEAIYKACPAPQPAYFRHYRLHTPELLSSEATIENTEYRFMVHSVELELGFVSLALRL